VESLKLGQGKFSHVMWGISHALLYIVREILRRHGEHEIMRISFRYKQHFPDLIIC